MTEKLLKGVRPNAGLAAIYRQRLDAMIEAMHRSIMRWVLAAYRENEPHTIGLAEDAGPADELQKVMRQLKKRWNGNFAEGGRELSKFFAKSAVKRSDAQLKAILKKAGFSVEFQMTRTMRDIAKATVHEGVSLIKSIPEQYLKDVEGAVMRSVQVGRDVGGLAEELGEKFGVAKRRAKFISTDQNNKATAMFNRARLLDVGLDESIWMHSSAAKHPRPTHAKAGRDKVRFKVSEGWYDPAVGRYIQPGELPNCGCTSRPFDPRFL